MRFALISDVHGNLEALEAVLATIDRRAPDARLVCAGDVVGYGPDPEACVELLRARDAIVVMGNHEQMVLGHRDFSNCVHAGVVAAMWTRRNLSEAVRTQLEALPASVDLGHGVVVCHGDLDDANTYIADETSARHALARLATAHPAAGGLVCGHTHHAMFFSGSTGLVAIAGSRTMALPTDERWILNPGAVGQSRDGKIHASFALLDTDESTVTWTSLQYDSRSTLEKLHRLGLVAKVVVERPRGVERRLENLRLDAARRQAAREPRRPPERAPVGPLAPPRHRAFVRDGRVALATTGATVLAYRAVTTERDRADVDPRAATSLTSFEKHVAFLARHRAVIPLARLVDLLERGTTPDDGTVVLTFDGAHRSFVEHVVPLLARHGLPATLFVPTRYVSTDSPPTADALFAAFNRRTRNVLQVPALGRRPVSLYDARVVRHAYLLLADQLHALPYDQRIELVANVQAQLRPAGAPTRSTATWRDLAVACELVPGLDVGVQTRHLVDLCQVSPEDASREIEDAVSDVRDALGIDARDLAYPYGRHDERVRALARRAGLRSACTAPAATPLDAGIDPFAIPRATAPQNIGLLRVLTRRSPIAGRRAPIPADPDRTRDPARGPITAADGVTADDQGSVGDEGSVGDDERQVSR
jgi:peptidoglycan/xylan/chitin deacetylase (PgdA/CDA1 family)/predicted phosphodiesterase